MTLLHQGSEERVLMDDRCCAKRKEAAVCGCYCGACDASLDGACCGCGYQLGQTRRGECAVFRCCVVERGLEHCGLCPDFACQVYWSHASPMDVARHYQALRRRTEIGTIAWLEEQGS
jgi:hypothetical protein